MELQILQWDREGEGQSCHTAVEGWLHLFPAVSAMKVNYSHLSHWQSLNMAITHCQRAPQRTWQARFFQSGLKTWFTKEGLRGSLAVCVMKKGLDRCIIHFFQQNYLDDKALWMSKGVHIVSRGLLNCLDVDFEPKIPKRKSSLVSEIKCTLQDWSSQAMYWFSIFMLLLQSELFFLGSGGSSLTACMVWDFEIPKLLNVSMHCLGRSRVQHHVLNSSRGAWSY